MFTCVLGACSRGSHDLLIGAAGSWDDAAGAMTKRGIDMAVEEINAAGGVSGRTVRVDDRNDGGSPARAAVIAQEFVDNPAIVAVVGHVDSDAMVAAAPVYNGNLVALSASATSPELSSISPWVFRIVSSDSVAGLEMAHFATKLGRTHAAIFYENNRGGRALADAFKRGFRGDIVSMDPIAAGDINAEPYIAFLKQTHPDVVFVAGQRESGISLLREARRTNLAIDFLSGRGWSGVTADTASAEGAYVATPFTSADSRPDATSFVEAFRTKFDMDPDDNAALAYDATRLLLQAISQAGDNRTRIKSYLASMNASNAFPGVTGSIRFAPDGGPASPTVVFTRSQHGQLTPVGTP
jgi:branched-chain amino acid transport system substrate-binding protein